MMEGVQAFQERLDRWGWDLSRLAPRIPGTTNMDKARDYLLDTFRSFGLEVWTEPINFRGVFFHKWLLRLTSPQNKVITSFPENNVGFGEVESELVDVGKGQESDYEGKDVAGKIVLVNWGKIADHEIPCGRGKRYPLLASYDRASVRRVAAMVGYFEDSPGNSLKLLEPGVKPTGGSNVPGPVETPPHNQFSLPVLNIGNADAHELKALMRGGPVALRLLIEGERKVSTVWNVLAKLPGQTEDTIMVGAHYCTAYTGAVCDTVGVVGALGIAQHFSGIPRSNRAKTLLFLLSGSHVWINCNISSRHFIEAHPEIMRKLCAYLWLDHISRPEAGGRETGVKRRDSRFRLTLASSNPILWLLTVLAMLRNRRWPVVLPISNLWTLCEMGPFDNRGIPAVTMQSMSDFLLTTEDTWDKIQPESLARDVGVFIDLARSIQRIPRPVLRFLDLPGRSLWGCGTLFRGTETPEYPPGESYTPEEPPPLYLGGYRSPIVTLTSDDDKAAIMRHKP